MIYLSVVIPVYKCSAAIPELIQRLEIAIPEITEDYEIIFINDGSPENDWEIVTQFAIENQKIKGINLSRNFGQQHAIQAGENELSMSKTETDKNIPLFADGQFMRTFTHLWDMCENIYLDI